MIVYCTYRQNGTLKKASIKEEQYLKLQENPAISDLTVYPNARLLEQAVSEEAGTNKRRMLHD